MKRSAVRRSPHAGNHGRGSHWIRDEKRRRIYERDSWRCVWCGCRVATSRQLVALSNFASKIGAATTPSQVLRTACLDHVLPRAKGGSNEAGNLVTSCLECNEARGDRCPIDYAFITVSDSVPDEDMGDAVAAMLERVIEAMGRELPPAPARPKKAAA